MNHFDRKKVVAMSKNRDAFRPRHEPVRSFYDALVQESKHRKKRTSEEWILAERLAVWRAARDYSQQQGLQVLLLADIERAESSACGHIDYASKLAYYVRNLLIDQKGKSDE